MAERHPISFEELLDYHEGRLAPAEAGCVAAHLAGCPSCQADLAFAARTQALMRSDRLASAPPAALERLVSLYRPPRRSPWWSRLQAFHNPGAAWRRLAAVLAVLVVLVGGWLASGRTPAAHAATITALQGAAQVRLPGASEWIPAHNGQQLPPGAALRIATMDAQVLLTYADGSQTALEGVGELSIADLAGRAGGALGIQLRQSGGRSSHHVAPGSAISVAAGGAQIRGEAGRYDVALAADVLEVQAFDAPVHLQVGAQQLDLPAGERAQVRAGHLETATPVPTPGAKATAQPKPAQTATPRPTPTQAVADQAKGRNRQPTPIEPAVEVTDMPPQPTPRVKPGHPSTRGGPERGKHDKQVERPPKPKRRR